MDRHYSFAALAEVLSQWGIDIRPDTLRRYLGPVDPNRRSRHGGSRQRIDRPWANRHHAGGTGPRAERTTARGSPDAIARLDTAWAETPPEPPVQPPRDPSGERPADPPAATPGTFTPRPERSIDWYKPSSNSKEHAR